jgi:hypothetical protein
LNPNADKAKLAEMVESGKMPPRNPNRPQIQAEEIAIILKWAGGKN